MQLIQIGISTKIKPAINGPLKYLQNVIILKVYGDNNVMCEV